MIKIDNAMGLLLIVLAMFLFWGAVIGAWELGFDLLILEIVRAIYF